MTRIIVIGCGALSVGSVAAAPVGYSVNSDAPNGDELFAIDLADGSATSRGAVTSGVENFMDVEGLAFDASGTLWAVDEQSLSLFPVNTVNATVDLNEVRPLLGINATSGNDFGMTFTCDDSLFISSVADGALYRLENSGSATLVGALNQNISALAAYGNPTRLFGLSNGLQADESTADSRSLYEIDPSTGALTLVGALGPAAADYLQAGLSFDANGNLWALTDRRIQGQDLGSEVLSIDLATGAATSVATTAETGFESLAVAPPAGCTAAPPPPAPTPTSGVPSIPTLDVYGKLAAVLTLLFAGFLGLRQRP
jgi:hypothetical protein